MPAPVSSCPRTCCELTARTHSSGGAGACQLAASGPSTVPVVADAFPTELKLVQVRLIEPSATAGLQLLFILSTPCETTTIAISQCSGFARPRC